MGNAATNPLRIRLRRLPPAVKVVFKDAAGKAAVYAQVTGPDIFFHSTTVENINGANVTGNQGSTHVLRSAAATSCPGPRP